MQYDLVVKRTLLLLLVSACATSSPPPQAASASANAKPVHVWAFDMKGGECGAYDISACPPFQKFVDPPCGGSFPEVGTIACPAWIHDGESAFIEQPAGATTCEVTADDTQTPAGVGPIACPPVAQ